MKQSNRKSFMVDSPVRVLMFPKKNKFFELNINSYRNLHWSLLNKSKRLYEDIMIPALMKSDSHLERYNKIEIIYQIYASNNRKFDSMNIIAIVDKYFQDTLSRVGIIKDDNWKIVKKITILPVIVDKGLPENLCRITVKEFNDEENM